MIVTDILTMMDEIAGSYPLSTSDAWPTRWHTLRNKLIEQAAQPAPVGTLEDKVTYAGVEIAFRKVNESTEYEFQYNGTHFGGYRFRVDALYAAKAKIDELIASGEVRK